MDRRKRVKKINLNLVGNCNDFDMIFKLKFYSGNRNESVRTDEIYEKKNIIFHLILFYDDLISFAI